MMQHQALGARAAEWVKGGRVVRAWTDVDDARLVEWTRAGHPLDQIALALGRSVSAVAQRRKIVADRIEAARQAHPARTPVAATGAAACGPAAAEIRRRLQARLAGLPRGKFWNVRRDLELAMGMAAGLPPAVLARDLRCDVSDVQARWLALCPDRAQAGVVPALIDLLASGVADG